MQAAVHTAGRAPVVLIGAGSLGRALTHSINTHSAGLATPHARGHAGYTGLRVVGLFDNKPSPKAALAEPVLAPGAVNERSGLKVANLGSISKFVTAFDVKTAVGATEPGDSQAAADAAVAAGVRRILNYSSAKLDVPDGVETIDAWDERLFELIGETPPARVGSRWSRYEREFETVRVLGSGNYGVVYEARNRLDGRRYAVKKILLRRLSAGESDQSGESDQNMLASLVRNSDAHAWRWMLREVRAMAAVAEHENVVRYHQSWLELSDADELANSSGSGSDCDDIDSSGGESWASSQQAGRREPRGAGCTALVLCIQMQLCDGETLAEAVQARDERADNEPLPLQFVLTVMRQMLAGVEHIHEAGFLHRDVKPGNVFLARAQARQEQDSSSSGSGGGSMDDLEGLTVRIGDLGLCAKLPTLADAQGQGTSPSGGDALTAADGGGDGDGNNSEDGVGTWTYAAPEQRAKRSSEDGVAAAAESEPRSSDVYSCGVILFELLHPGFRTGMQRSIDLRGFRDDGVLPGEMSALMASSISPGDRIGSAVRQLRESLCALSLSMTKLEPSERPTVADARLQLGELSAALDAAVADRSTAVARSDTTDDVAAMVATMAAQAARIGQLEDALRAERLLRELQMAALLRQQERPQQAASSTAPL